MSTPQDADGVDDRTAALDRLGEAVLALARESRQDRETRSRRDRLHLVLLAVVALMVAGLGTLAVQNQQTHAGNAEILATMRDCTTDGGTCFEAGDERIEQRLRALIAAEMDIAWCIKTSTTKTAAQRCVAEAQRGR